MSFFFSFFFFFLRVFRILIDYHDIVYWYCQSVHFVCYASILDFIIEIFNNDRWIDILDYDALQYVTNL